MNAQYCTTPSSKFTPAMTTLSSSSCSSSSSSSSANARLPAGDSPYVRAKHAQLVDKDPNKAVPLFWAAINNGDRVDSALKDMAVVMKQLNRAEEAIEAIKSFRSLCSINAQDPIDNLLLDLYKKCGRMEDQIELLSFKLKLIDEGLAFGGRTTKLSRSQGKKFHVSLDKERSRLLGNLAWAYMQIENYQEAEPLYRRALAIENDYNKQCNLAICLMKTGRLSEAETLLQAVPKPSSNYNGEPYLKSFERAFEIVKELQQSTPHASKEVEGVRGVARSIDVPDLSNELYSTPCYVTLHSEYRRGRRIQDDEVFQFPASVSGEPKILHAKGVKKEKGQKHRIKGSKKGSCRTLSTDKKADDGSWKNGFCANSESLDESLQAQSERSNSSNEERKCVDDSKEEDPFLTPSAVNRAHFDTPTSTGILEGNMGVSGEALSQGYFFTDEEKRNSAADTNTIEDQAREAPPRHSCSLTLEEKVPSGCWKKNSKKLGVPIRSPFPVGAAEGKASPGLGSDAISQDTTGVNGEKKNAPYKSLKFGCSQNSLDGNLMPIIGEGGFKTSSVSSKGRRTWADMVEEEEEEEDLMACASTSFMKWDEKNVFADENVNSNAIGSIPQQKHQIERLCKNPNKIDINVGSRSARRSLSFNLGSDVKRKNRLQVFREITPDD